jgi:hypothetical protein
MEDVNMWAQFISSMGFPIAASCAMFYLYNKTITDITNTLNLMNQTLREIVHRLEVDDGSKGKSSQDHGASG